MRGRSVRDVCPDRPRVTLHPETPLTGRRGAAGGGQACAQCLCSPPGERPPTQWLAPVRGPCVPMHREPGRGNQGLLAHPRHAKAPCPQGPKGSLESQHGKTVSLVLAGLGAAAEPRQPPCPRLGVGSLAQGGESGGAALRDRHAPDDGSLRRRSLGFGETAHVAAPHRGAERSGAGGRRSALVPLRFPSPAWHTPCDSRSESMAAHAGEVGGQANGAEPPERRDNSAAGGMPVAAHREVPMVAARVALRPCGAGGVAPLPAAGRLRVLAHRETKDVADGVRAGVAAARHHQVIASPAASLPTAINAPPAPPLRDAHLEGDATPIGAGPLVAVGAQRFRRHADARRIARRGVGIMAALPGTRLGEGLLFHAPMGRSRRDAEAGNRPQVAVYAAKIGLLRVAGNKRTHAGEHPGKPKVVTRKTNGIRALAAKSGGKVLAPGRAPLDLSITLFWQGQRQERRFAVPLRHKYEHRLSRSAGDRGY